VIALNGPNLLSEHSKKLCSQSDIIGFSSGIFIDFIKPRYFFHEPWESIPSAYSHQVQYDLYQTLFLTMEIPILESLIARAQQTEFYVIQNQQPFPDYFLSFPDESKKYTCQFYFCDETSFVSGHRSCIPYIQQRLWKTGCLLNYRCSLIRAFTLSLSLGYHKIYIVGLNPSTPHYWFSADPMVGASHILPALDRGLYSQLFSNAHRLINAIGNESFDVQALSSQVSNIEKERKTITNVFFSFLSACFAKCPDVFEDTSVIVVSDDPLVLGYAKQYHLEHLLESTTAV